MNNCIIDTSIWIDYLNGNLESPVKEKINNLIIENNIWYNGVILTELLSGYSKESDQNKIIDMMSGLNYIDLKHQDYISIAKKNIFLLSKGYKIPISDLIIFCTALENDLLLITKDKHFKYIKEVINYKLDFIKL